jgi:uncharacterized protein YciI
MPQYLYRIQPTRLNMLKESPTEFESAIIDVHFDYLQKLNSEGYVLMAGRTLNTDETSFGIVIFTAENETNAKEIMLNDPAVKFQVMHAELFPYRIALWPKSIPEEEKA